VNFNIFNRNNNSILRTVPALVYTIILRISRLYMDLRMVYVTETCRPY